MLVLIIATSACALVKPKAPLDGSVTSIPKVIELVSVKVAPIALAADETHLYWSARGPLNIDGTWNTKVIDNSIMRANKDGSNLVTLATGLYPPWVITVDSTHIYWMSIDGVKKMPKEGGAVMSLTTWPIPGPGYEVDAHPDFDIAVDETHVYLAKCGTSSVMKLNKQGGETIPLTVERKCPTDIALDADNVYWIDLEDYGSLMKVSKDGKQLTTLLRGHGGLSDLWVDDTGVYWINDLDFINRQSGSVNRMALNGEKSTRLASGQQYPKHLLVDQTNLYWVEGLEQKILMKMPKKGGTPQQIISDVGYITDIVIDETQIFMIISGRRVVVIPK